MPTLVAMPSLCSWRDIWHEKNLCWKQSYETIDALSAILSEIQ